MPLTLSCGSRHAQKATVNLIVPRACLLADPVMKKCDTRVDPPKCATATVTYKRGCGIIASQKGGAN